MLCCNESWSWRSKLDQVTGDLSSMNYAGLQCHSKKYFTFISRYSRSCSKAEVMRFHWLAKAIVESNELHCKHDGFWTHSLNCTTKVPFEALNSSKYHDIRLSFSGELACFSQISTRRSPAKPCCLHLTRFGILSTSFNCKMTCGHAIPFDLLSSSHWYTYSFLQTIPFLHANFTCFC